MVYPVKWVTLSRYCELTGEGHDAVRKWIRAGFWLDGREYRKTRGRIKVNVEAADRWQESSENAA